MSKNERERKRGKRVRQQTSDWLVTSRESEREQRKLFFSFSSPTLFPSRARSLHKELTTDMAAPIAIRRETDVERRKRKERRFFLFEREKFIFFWRERSVKILSLFVFRHFRSEISFTSRLFSFRSTVLLPAKTSLLLPLSRPETALSQRPTPPHRTSSSRTAAANRFCFLSFVLSFAGAPPIELCRRPAIKVFKSSPLLPLSSPLLPLSFDQDAARDDGERGAFLFWRMLTSENSKAREC